MNFKPSQQFVKTSNIWATDYLASYIIAYLKFINCKVSNSHKVIHHDPVSMKSGASNFHWFLCNHLGWITRLDQFSAFTVYMFMLSNITARRISEGLYIVFNIRLFFSSHLFVVHILTKYFTLWQRWLTRYGYMLDKSFLGF